MIYAIEVNEIQYRIEWVFTADLKFLVLCSGIEAANSIGLLVCGANAHLNINMMLLISGQ